MNNPVIRIERVTPEKAAEYLASNTNNRPLRELRTRTYAEAMKRGEWRVNNDAICFDVNGVLLNGQHRLNAVIIAGVAVDMTIMRGMEPSSFLTMDRGAARGVSDHLAMLGEVSTRQLGATLAYVIQYQQGSRIAEN